MALKTPDLLNRLPSVTELLEKPPIKALSERWNRSVVASGVRSFLDELRSDLQRRAANLQLPPIRELAERAARHIITQRERSERPAVNATGVIWGARWVNTPIADEALERVFTLGRDFAVGRAVSPGNAPATADIEPLICRLTGAQAATVVHSYAGAIWLTTASLAAGREVLISRGEMGEIGSAGPLGRLIASAGGVVTEVGATNRTRASDYEMCITLKAAAILKSHPDEFQIVGKTESPHLEELVSIARERDLTLVDALGVAPLAERGTPAGWPRESVSSSLRRGADLVVVRGDGLVGGPACGILAGRSEVVERITRHPMFSAWQLDALRSAALAATLESHANQTNGEPTIPIWQLLTTPLENLRNRAQRLAPQIAQFPGIATAEPVDTRSPLTPARLYEDGLASCGVAVTAANGELDAVNKRLVGASQPVFGRIEEGRLILDLRTVLPRHDQAIVEALSAPPAGNNPE